MSTQNSVGCVRALILSAASDQHSLEITVSYCLTFKIRQSSIWYGGTMGQQNNCPTVWWSNDYFDKLGIIQWDTISWKIPFRIILYYFFYFFYNLKNKIQLFINSLIYPKTKSATHCLTKLFPIYQNEHCVGPSDGGMIIPSSHCIILKISRY